MTMLIIPSLMYSTAWGLYFSWSVNTVVVCACSPRVMQKEFCFGEGTITVRGNLREQVAWTAGEKPEDGSVDEFLQELACDYVRMAVTRAQKTALPEPYKLESISKRILVMGGGIAGLTAAKEAAAAGYEVTLVEKEGELGGKALAGGAVNRASRRLCPRVASRRRPV